MAGEETGRQRGSRPPSSVPDVSDLAGTWAGHETSAFAPEPGQDIFVVQTPLIAEGVGGPSLLDLRPHVLGDMIARFERMRGKAVFQPIGWSIQLGRVEREVRRTSSVRCDPRLPPGSAPQRPPRPDPSSTPEVADVGVDDFRRLCESAAVELYGGESNDFFLDLLGIAPGARHRARSSEASRVAQLAFLRNLARGELELRNAPTYWDVELQTAVASREVRREVDLHYAPFVSCLSSSGDSLSVRVGRPELMASAVALVVHPDDERYRSLVGATATIPVFGVDVPILAHRRASPSRDAGVAMCCTFGSMVEATWWRDLDLPLRTTIGRDGRLMSAPPPWLTADGAVEAYGQIAGLGRRAAARAVEAMLHARQSIVDAPAPASVPEPAPADPGGRRRGRLERDRRQRSRKPYPPGSSRPLEILPSWQWYLRDPHEPAPADADPRHSGEDVTWLPASMRARCADGLAALEHDFLMSEQRFFGTPVPVWFPLDGGGQPDRGHPLVPDPKDLPVDPHTSTPPGYVEDQRGRPGGFTGDVGILSPLATSSLASLLMSGWESDPSLFAQVHPASLYVGADGLVGVQQSAELLRARLEKTSVPWERALIAGPVVEDAFAFSSLPSPWGWNRPAMAHGADAFRWRVAKARPGAATPHEASFREGRKLAVKVLNVTRLVHDLAGPGSPDLAAVCEPVDIAMLDRLSRTVAAATRELEALRYGAGLAAVERFFWLFARDYVELVKDRARGREMSAGTLSARTTLAVSVDVQLRLLAPFMPFVTQEAWSWGRTGSIHESSWPRPAELGDPSEFDPRLADVAFAILARVRGAKSAAGVSLAAEVASVHITGPWDLVGTARLVATDLRNAGKVTGDLSFALDDEAMALRVGVTLGR